MAVGRAVSRKHAMEMALTGALYSAEEAERFGLVNRVVPAGAGARRSAETRRDNRGAFGGGGGDRQARVLSADRTPLAEAYALASQAMVDNLAHPDAGEGIDAFLEKREPRREGA